MVAVTPVGSPLTIERATVCCPEVHELVGDPEKALGRALDAVLMKV